MRSVDFTSESYLCEAQFTSQSFDLSKYLDYEEKAGGEGGKGCEITCCAFFYPSSSSSLKQTHFSHMAAANGFKSVTVGNQHFFTALIGGCVESKRQ